MSKSISFHKWNKHVQIWERAKSNIFKKLGKHWFGSLHQKLECGASLNAREVTRGKKVDIGENAQLKYCANR